MNWFTQWQKNKGDPNLQAAPKPDPKPQPVNPAKTTGSDIIPNVPASSASSGTLPEASPSVSFVRGIDVSHYEPVVNYTEAYAQGNRFVFAKATDGSGATDAMFPSHRADSKAAGHIFGSFHFLRFQGLSPKVQAEVFFKATGGVLPGELPPVLDVEWDNSQGPSGKYADNKEMDDAAADIALACLEEIEYLFGVTPIIYTHHYFFTGFKNPERFAKYPVWLTQPSADSPTIPTPWKTWMFFQNSFHEKGLASQNPDGIDSDLFNGPLDALKAMAKK